VFVDDILNTAARLEEHAKRSGLALVAWQTVLDRLELPSDVGTTRCGELTSRGKDSRVIAYSLIHSAEGCCRDCCPAPPGARIAVLADEHIGQDGQHVTPLDDARRRLQGVQLALPSRQSASEQRAHHRLDPFPARHLVRGDRVGVRPTRGLNSRR